jgi:uncharacterized protein YjbI with pentapeptide repeats
VTISLVGGKVAGYLSGLQPFAGSFDPGKMQVRSNMADKIDPFDVAALERSLNESAARVSAIWVSYLVFALYLLISTGTATHRQLFFEEPFKLPVLNIDLPLYWFFVLAPILFVLFHFYVLLQVLLLGRTAVAYNDTLDAAIKSPAQNALIRQRLSNTLFAQIFAGSPRERQGWLGSLIKAMAWITLAIAPVCVLLAFQFTFLPYHSHFATWTHRALILGELAIASFLFPIALDARRDLDFSRLRALGQRKTSSKKPPPLPSSDLQRDWKQIATRAAFATLWLAFVAISILLGSFPGEPIINVASLRPPDAVECTSFAFDHFVLPGIDPHEKAKSASDVNRETPIHLFRGRNLTCGIFSDAKLRDVDLTGAQLQGADLERADLGNANLRGAQLRLSRAPKASLKKADLREADLRWVDLEDTDFTRANLEGADLSGASAYSSDFSAAKLEKASLRNANLHGATFDGAEMLAARLSGSRLDGASFVGAHMVIADLRGTDLRGARLDASFLAAASLEGADLNNASLRGAWLHDARLQGTILKDSNLRLAWFQKTNLWRSRGNCQDAHVVEPAFDDKLAIFAKDRFAAPTFEQVTPETLERFILDAIIGPVSILVRGEPEKRLDQAFTSKIDDSELASMSADWQKCAELSKQTSESAYYQQLADLLVTIFCGGRPLGEEGAEAAVGRWFEFLVDSQESPDLRNRLGQGLARGLLARDGAPCAGAKDLPQGQLRDRLAKLADGNAGSH